MPGTDSTAMHGGAVRPLRAQGRRSGGRSATRSRDCTSCCRESPVHVGPIDLGEGAEIADPTKPPPVTVFGFDEVVQVLRDNETYSSSVYAEVMGMVMGRTMLQMDEPEHRAIRALVAGELPLQGARALGGGAGRPRGQRAGRHLHRSGPYGPRARRSPSTSPCRSSPASSGLPRRTTRGSSAGRSSSRASPPTGSGAWPPRRLCATTSPTSWPSAAPHPGTTSSATWCGRRSTASS